MMFITFHSKAYEKISYFKNIGEQLIYMMGHSGAVPGAIKFEGLSTALTGLQQGLAEDEQREAKHVKDDDSISLTKRASPLVHLLQASIENECAILWDWSSSP